MFGDKRIDDLVSELEARIKELEGQLEGATDGWDRYRELRKEVGQDKYPSLTNDVILNIPKAHNEMSEQAQKRIAELEEELRIANANADLNRVMELGYKAQLDAVQEWNRFYGAMLREGYPVAYTELQAALNGEDDG